MIIIMILNGLKQTIGNGCGLYALLHILTNLPQDLIISNSKLSQLRNNLTKVKNFLLMIEQNY